MPPATTSASRDPLPLPVGGSGLRGPDFAAVINQRLYVFEITATTSHLVERVTHYLNMLGQIRDLDSVPSVVFVIANKPRNRGARSDSGTPATAKKVFEAAAARLPANSPVRDKIAVVHWEDWFPAAHWASEAYTHLRVRKLPPQDQPGDWSINYLGHAGHPQLRAWGSPSGRAELTTTGANLLWQTPWWLRPPNRPAYRADLEELVMAPHGRTPVFIDPSLEREWIEYLNDERRRLQDGDPDTEKLES